MTYRGLFWPLFHHLTLAHSRLWAIWSHQLYPTASAFCLFQLSQQTKTGSSIFYPSSPKTAGLMSCSLSATPFLGCVAGNLHTAYVCMCCVHIYTRSCMCCEHNINMQQHDQCVLASLLHPSIFISHSAPPSVRLSSLHSSAGTLSLRAKPGWTLGWMDGLGQG